MAQLAQHMAAGNAAGGIGYGGDDDSGGTSRRRRQSKRQKGGSQKRKLEKAQEHLRSKMRQRLNGPAMVSSRVQGRVGSSSTGTTGGGSESLEEDGRGGDATLNPRVNPLNSKEDRKHGHVGKKKQLTGNYWRTQQQRYTNLTHPTGGTGNPTGGTGNRTSTSSQEDVPLHDLVDRVRNLQRKGKSNNISPLIIRAYNKPPNPQYKIQQHPLARTMPSGQPVATLRNKHPKDKGPYVVVLHRDQPHHQDTEGYTPSDVEMNTWRPELPGVSWKQNSSKDGISGEDRGVTNYKLQLQHAAKLAEARFDYSNRATNALPPIKVEKVSRTRRQSRDESHLDSSSSSSSSSDSGDSDQDDIQTNAKADNRVTSNQDILIRMQAYKRARRRVSENDFKTILRTRNRFTAKTKQFKEDLTKAKALSVIDEDQSSVSSGRNSCLSARRNSQTSLRNVSAKSLNRIEETKTPEPDHDIQDAKSSQMVAAVDRSTGVIEEGDEEETDMITDDDDDDDGFLNDSRTSLPNEFSFNSNPLPAIMHVISHPTDNGERDVARTTQRTEQTIQLPSRSVIPEIGK